MVVRYRRCRHCDAFLAGRRDDARYCSERCRGRVRRRIARRFEADAFPNGSPTLDEMLAAAEKQGYERGLAEGHMKVDDEARKLKKLVAEIAARHQRQRTA